ncbi:MAG: ParA family protein [Rhodospirillaceae bacterium]
MFKIALFNSTAAVGKTVLAKELAVEASAQGLRTCLYDADRAQRRLEGWFGARPLGGPALVEYDTDQQLCDGRLASVEGEMDVCIIDTPSGEFFMETADALLTADLVLVPVTPAAMSSQRLDELSYHLAQANGRIAYVVSMAGADHGHDPERAKDELRRRGAALDTVLEDDTDYATGLELGLGAAEVNAAGAAGERAWKLWGEAWALISGGASPAPLIRPAAPAWPAKAVLAKQPDSE